MSSEKDSGGTECATKEDMKVETPDESTLDNLTNLLDNILLDEKKLSNTNESGKKTEIKNTVTIPPWLGECESPFLWDTQQKRGLSPDVVILKALEKLDELLIEEPAFSVQRFVSLSILVLEYYVAGDIPKSDQYMKIMEGCLEEEISRNEPSYQQYKLPLGHIVSATKAHVLNILGTEEESKKIGRCIIPFKIMSDTDKAGIYSMKARFFFCSAYENTDEVCVDFARKALELEPENADNEYFLAKALRQQRRNKLFSTEVPRDELKLLESAVKRDKNPRFLVYLAQVYRECANLAFREYRNHPNFHDELKPSIDLMSAQSLKHYKEALALNPDCPAVLRRVGYGLMNLHKKYADYDLALECLQKSVEITDNLLTVHILGTYYLRYGNDKKKALEYFERCAKEGSAAGLSDMVRVKWMLDPQNYNPCPDLELGLSWMLKKKDHYSFLVQLGGYYLFIKRDFGKAIGYFKEVLLEDKNSPYLITFKSSFLKMNKLININEYLVNEALLLARKKDGSSTVEVGADGQPVDIELLENFLKLMSELHPELMEMTPDENLVPALIRESKNIEASWNNHRGGRGQGNRSYYPGGRGRGGRGGYGNYRRGNQDGERRGRYSGNPRDHESHGEGRGRGSRGSRNWNSRPRNEGRGDDNGGQENWRKR